MEQSERCNKLILAVLQGDDYDDVVHTLNENGFYVTLLNSMGGFLRKRSFTIMVGLPEERLSYALDILKRKAGHRRETVFQNIMPPHYAEPSMMPAVPVQMACGGATVFVLDLESIQHF